MSELNLEELQPPSPSARSTLIWSYPNSPASISYEPPSTLENQLKMTRTRHLSRLRNVNIRAAVSLIYKYKATSQSALYDACTAEEWANLIYLANGPINNYVNVGLELFVKDNLELQRKNRWDWLVSTEEYDFDQHQEILHIFEINNIDIRSFMNTLYVILNCVNEKINCLFLYGASNSCKTLIARLICNTFVHACVNNHNSENEFFLSCFLNKGIALCEELMITPATAEDFKSILGGAPLMISKKYNEKQVLIRTPIIVTSNHDNFGRGHVPPLDEAALKNRCFTYKFTSPYKPKCHISAPAFAHVAKRFLL